MRYPNIGRGILTALVASAMCLAACDTESGSNEQAITNTDIPAAGTIGNLTYNPGTGSVAKYHQYGSGCEISDSGHTYFLVAGGRDMNPQNTIHLIEDNGTVINYEQTFTNAREHLTIVNDPGRANACVSFGGVNAGTSQGSVLRFTLSHSGMPLVPSIAVSNVATLTTARAGIQALPCAANKVVLTNGFTGAGVESDVIEVYDFSNDTIATMKNTNAAPATVTLNTARYGSAAAMDTANSVLAIGGGRDANGRFSDVEVFPLTDQCELDNNSVSGAGGTLAHPSQVANVLQNGNSMSPAVEARDGLAALYDAVNSKFVFATGHAAGGDKATQDLVTFTISGTTAKTAALNTQATSTPANLVAVSYASFLEKPGASRLFLVGGGSNYASTGSAVRNIQEYDSAGGGTFTNTTTRTDSSNLPVTSGAVLAYMTGQSALFFGLGGTTVPGGVFNTTEKANR